MVEWHVFFPYSFLFLIDFNRFFRLAMDIDTRGIGLLVAQHLSLYVIPLALPFVNGQGTDARTFRQIDDEWLPRRADDGIAAERHLGADGGNAVADGGTDLHGLAAALTGNEQVVEAAVG